jgi:aspartyl-tRNA(Asn)/glutamyl-tRNA(Gln) amidotransferase subunit C
MALVRQDVERVAQLARLAVDKQEVDAYFESLSRILGLIEQMSAADTHGVVPMAHPQEGGLRLRDDQVAETDQRAKFQQIAPATEAGLYLVPKVIE